MSDIHNIVEETSEIMELAFDIMKKDFGAVRTGKA